MIPRPATEARAIARTLRERFVTQETETAVCIALARLAPPLPPTSPPLVPELALEEQATGAKRRAQSLFRSLSGAGKKEPDDKPVTLVSMIRKREGIDDPDAPIVFSDEEKQQARQILDEILRRYRA